MIHYIKDIFAGFIIGVANIIPGVSGGTFALILGLYHRLLGFLNQLGPAQVKILIQSLKQGGLRGLAKEMGKRDYWFMARISLGAGVGILSLSALMKFLLSNHHELTYAFFFGLILMSVVIPFRMVKQWRGKEIVALVLGVILTAGSAQMVDPAEKAINKSKIYQARLAAASSDSADNVVAGDAVAGLESKENTQGHYTLTEYILVFLAGIIAVSAMVLPGISGSLILILLGQYYPVINALSSLRHPTVSAVLFLSALGFGVVLGLLLFSRFLEWAFSRWYNPVLGFLTGLVLGSLWPLWPLKHFVFQDVYQKGTDGIVLVQNAKLYTNQNTLTASANLWVGILLCILAGMALMVYFVRKGPEKE